MTFSTYVRRFVLSLLPFAALLVVGPLHAGTTKEVAQCPAECLAQYPMHGGMGHRMVGGYPWYATEGPWYAVAGVLWLALVVAAIASLVALTVYLWRRSKLPGGA